jgi:hypothetical protein
VTNVEVQFNPLLYVAPKPLEEAPPAKEIVCPVVPIVIVVELVCVINELEFEF